MCDNPKINPWDVLVDPALVVEILPALLRGKRGIDEVRRRNPELRQIPREKLVRLLEGIEQKKIVLKSGAESNLAHVEFDIRRAKKLSEEQLRELLSNKLIPRIIEDMKKLEVNRPIPDWCYAFF